MPPPPGELSEFDETGGATAARRRAAKGELPDEGGRLMGHLVSCAVAPSRRWRDSTLSRRQRRTG